MEGLSFQNPKAEMFERHRLASGSGSGNSGEQGPYLLNLYVDGGINLCYFNFLLNDAHLFYPAPIASVGVQSFARSNSNMTGAGVSLYENLSSTSWNGTRPFEAVFNGRETNGDKPVYNFGVSYLLSSSLKNSAQFFSVINVKRDFPSPGSPTPRIKLWEVFTVNGEVTARKWVDHVLTESEMHDCSWPIG